MKHGLDFPNYVMKRILMQSHALFITNLSSWVAHLTIPTIPSHFDQVSKKLLTPNLNPRTLTSWVYDNPVKVKAKVSQKIFGNKNTLLPPISSFSATDFVDKNIRLISWIPHSVYFPDICNQFPLCRNFPVINEFCNKIIR